MRPMPARVLSHALAAVTCLGAADVARALSWSGYFDIDGTVDVVRIPEAVEFSSGSWQANETYVGTLGSEGSITQRGGSFYTQSMGLGYDVGTQGSYFLEGGSLQVDRLQIAALYGGVFQQSNGILTAGDLLVGTQSCCRGGNVGDLRLKAGLRSIDRMRVGSSSFASLGGGTTIARELVAGVYGDLTISGGTHTVLDRLWVETAALNIGRGSGSLAMSGGTVIGRVDNEGLFSWSGGTIQGTLNTSVWGALELRGAVGVDGAMRNEGLLTVLKSSQWTVGRGGFVNAASGTTQLQDALVTLESDLVNQGVLQGLGTFTGDAKIVNEGRLIAYDGPQFVIDAGAMQNKGVLELRSIVLRGRATVSNEAGAKLVSSGSSTIENRLDNLGRIEVGAGTLQMAGELTHSGEIVLTAADAVYSGGAFENRGRITGQGYFKAPMDNRGLVRAEGGELRLAFTPSLRGPDAVLAAANGATLVLESGLPRLTDGTLRLEGGSVRVAGAMANEARIDGQGTLVTGGLVNRAGMSFAAGASRLEGGLDLAGGSFSLAESADVVVDGVATLRRTADVDMAEGSSLRFSGAVLVEDGFVSTGGGDQRFDADLTLDAGFGHASLGGSVTLGDASVLSLDLGAAASDRLWVQETLAFGGTLRLVLAEGFQPEAGTRFDVFGWGLQATGGFRDVDTSAAALGDGLRWDTRALASHGVLQVSAVPEPAAWALWALGVPLLAAAAARGKRRCGREELVEGLQAARSGSKHGLQT